MKISFILFASLMLHAASVSAQSKFVERSTDVLCLAPSATGLIKAIAEKDKKGILQLGLSTATTLAINYGLEAVIKKDRPDGTGRHAFPSTHTAVAFDGASFLLRRYGWAWGRTYAKRHDWWDVLGGAAIGAGAAFIYTRPFVKKADVSIAPASFGDGGGISMVVNF